MREPPLHHKLLGTIVFGGGFIWLASCASQPAKLPPPAPVQASLCLPLTTYSPDQQKALAAQLATLPSDSPVALAMTDYLRMRDSDRACLTSK